MELERVNSVGFFIGSENLYWVILESHTDGQIEVLRTEKIYFNQPLDYQNYLSQENRIHLLNALEKSVKSGLFKDRKINISIDSRLTYVLKIPVEANLHPQELKEHLIWEFQQHFINEKHEDYLLSFHPIQLKNQEKFNSLILLVIKKTLLNFYKHIFEDLQLKIKVTDIDHFSAETICKFSYPEFEKSYNFLISVKDSCLDVSFFISGEVFSYRKIKFKENQEIINFFEKDISPTIKTMKQKIGKIYIWGENVKQRLVDELNSIVPVEVVLINPFRKFIINKAVLNSPVYENLHEFTPACGIALRNK